MYFIKTPFWLRLIYRSCIWRKPTQDRVLYLSFDDGPHPEATPFVLEQLAIFNAKASFFCIGKNVQLYPNIYAALIEANHTVGNHTQNHMNGWKNNTTNYIVDIQEATKSISSNLFRPPYGRISFSQIKALRLDPSLPQEIIMWDVLSGDFDTTISGDQCAQNVIQHAVPGSIIVFHDSAKAMDRLRVALPKVLSHLVNKGINLRHCKCCN
jgi:peptidoglycan/xylan/chitin deacetylase (PgdA/CDA1 family)